MKIELISRLFILIVTLTFSNLAESNDDAFSENLRNCNLKQRKAQCWKPAEVYLQGLPAPSISKDFLNRFENYYLLAKTAHYVGDFADADRLYHVVEEFNKMSPKYAELKGMDITPMIQYDHGMSYLSTHSYKSALNMFENAERAASNIEGYDHFKFENLIGKASALIGLSDWRGLEKVLNELSSSLDFKQIAPWEGWPFGPQLIGPYSTGRRIVAAYVRMKQYDRALALIDQIENERDQVMAARTKLEYQPIQTRPWSALCNPNDLKADKSEILILQGKFRQAEEVLKPMLQIDLSDHSNIRKRVLTKLAKIEEKKGNKKSQIEFSHEAASLIINESEIQFDPLAETFGYIP